jgi:serine/threonine-protein kinase HipA
MTRELEVLLHRRPIGTLTEDAFGRWVLRFADSYRQTQERPVLGQKFEDALERSYAGKTRGALPPFFANLIPERDGELRPLLEDVLGVPSDDDAALLEALGRDLPGAVEVRTVSADEHVRPGAFDDTVEPTLAHDEDHESLRFSLAGVQLKFSVILANDKVTLPAHGGLGDWLVKLDSRRFACLCENEYAIMSWARRAGFDVPECRLLPSSALLGTLGEYAEPDTYVLMIRRYDRVDGVKIHQEDFAQVVNLAPKHKYDHVSYEQLVRLVEKIIGADARDEIIRRMVFMIASGNGDAHLKNWSLIYPDRVSAKLAPLYDQVATVAWPELDRKLALAFAGIKDMSQLDRDRVSLFADRGGFDPKAVLEIVDATLEVLARAWTEASRASEWTMPAAHMVALRDHWQRTPLLRDSALTRDAG